ncbi:hypothetical protein GUITHDRAFT_145640 [Guillardia theta CCMP2712]|uniref:Coronin n=1 Tax=Guillardia theta (strain CCMP2712) TaxID=905079 RepID=L1IKD6_GUITC|nr:hypothetical protein GUITHDRAFT_145640 [Guillardia theta CCMP2712]EKX36582.1 hypothetical protein GUITHDRAFT_145640 [Guillardia theta CCMP2712]|eukprot:XP_005823562.1 hypothetical protein GUITHDRAFT_145640 [Guillardia theta CCMP2712]
MDSTSPLKEDADDKCSVQLQGHSKKVMLARWNPVADGIVLSSSFDNTVRIWDANKAAEFRSIELPDSPQHIAWNYDGSLFASTCSIAQKVASQGGSKGAHACFLGETSMLATVGFSAQSDRQIILRDSRDITKPLVLHSIDHDFGMLFPFFDPDTNILYLAGKGDCNIRYYEIVSTDPYIHFLDDCDKYVEPVSFTVPRRADQSNDDLYPPTYAGKSCLSGPEVKAEHTGTAKGNECLKETAGGKGNEAGCDFGTSTSGCRHGAEECEEQQPSKAAAEKADSESRAEPPAVEHQPETKTVEKSDAYPLPEETSFQVFQTVGGVELKGTLTVTVNTNDRMKEMEKRIKELESENAELRAKLNAK